MEKVMFSSGRIPAYSWLPVDKLEEGALEQIQACTAHPKAYHHMAVMPDCHQGYGMPIGGVVALDGAISPNMVGVDIGCGMSVVRTNAKFVHTYQIKEILNRLKTMVPVGEGKFRSDPVSWPKWVEYLDKVKERPDWMKGSNWHRFKCSMGTLGGGNHFLELQRDEEGYLYMMLHSGSRGLGYAIAKYYNELAQTYCVNLDIPNKDLAYLPTDHKWGQAYIRDMNFALAFAKENRRVMMDAFKFAFFHVLGSPVREDIDVVDEIDIHHNYAALEHHFGKDLWVHRKGATSAQSGQLGIIPGSMGTHSYVVAGKGNPDSFKSCSHGAGRVKGRMAATRELDRMEQERKMDGIVFDGFKTLKKGKLKGAYDLGEAPDAYKNIDTVMWHQGDLVDVVVKLKPIGVLKG